ncbi:MAG TPA: DUF2807 domain-containing protein, partial [Patescibacteria group bacterium]|nr:DUF2807 domain-containing protein [Patescibacteria group bacterium]
VLFVPLVCIILLGTSVVSGRSAFNKGVGLSLLGLWILAIIVAANTGIRLVPQIQEIVENDPSYQMETRVLPLTGFTAIEVKGYDSVEILQSENFEVTVRGRVRDLDRAVTAIENNTLTVDRNREQRCLFCSHGHIHYTIYMPKVSSVTATGASRVTAILDAATFTAAVSGASRLEAYGTATRLELNLDGASRVNAQNLAASQVRITSDGASRVNLKKVDELQVDLDGASTVIYEDAAKVTESRRGASRIIKRSINNQ